MTRFNLEKALQIVQFIFFCCLIFYFILMTVQYFSGVLALLISAGLIAFLSHEMITPMVKRGFSVNGAMAIVYVSIICTIILAVILMFPVLADQASELVKNIPQTVNSIGDTVTSFFKPLSKVGLHINLQKFNGKVIDYIQSGFFKITENFPSFLINSFSFLIDAIIVVVISIYLVKDFDEMWISFLDKTGIHSPKWEYLRLELTKSLRGFVKGQLFSGIYMLIATSTAYTFIGLKFGLIAGVILGSLEVIPYFGAFIGMILVSALALSQSLTMFLLALVLTVIIQQIKDNILLPRWLSDSIGIHPLAVFISILVGGKVAGVMGIFLAIPAAGLVQALIRVMFSTNRELQLEIDEKTGETE